MDGQTTIKTNEYTYRGEWQEGAAHLEKLEGPVDHGIVEYANGDRFEGDFLLSFCSISCESYTALGEYRFADGSVIKEAWLVNTKRGGALTGLYRVEHPNGPDTITPFDDRMRDGLEIVLAEKPYAIEWKEGEKVQELEVVSHNFEIFDYDYLNKLTITLADGTVVTERGGRMVSNSYGFDHFKPDLDKYVFYADTSKTDLLKGDFEKVDTRM